jgi:hypothetical protein
MYAGNAASTNATLSPILTAQAVNPQGYTPQQMSAQTTAAEQSAGGSNSGATGGALLRAARTRNLGSGQAAVSQSSQNAGENLSQTNAGIQNASANKATQQQGRAISGLESLYGTDTGASIGALNSSTNAYSDAGHLNNFWQQLLQQGIQTGGQVASAGLTGG